MKPNDIPQDAWNAADAVMKAAADDVVRILNSGDSVPEDGVMLPLVAQAIMAERNRCIGIALSFIQYGGDTHHGITMDSMADAAQIAAAIRNRAPAI